MTEHQVQVYVALGSNLGERAAHIRGAAKQVAGLPASSELVLSSLYETDPMGPENQPDYLNAVCSFTWRDAARDLLDELQVIEQLHGRVKTSRRWTARPLDLDILLFGTEQIHQPDLQIPHVGIAERSFVLWPLAELNSDLVIPGLGPIAALLPECRHYGIKRYIDTAADAD